MKEENTFSDLMVPFKNNWSHLLLIIHFATGDKYAEENFVFAYNLQLQFSYKE